MKISQAGILVLLLFTVLTGASCSYYNRIIAQKNLVDGAQAYKDRKFEEAEKHFRIAVETDPTLQLAQLFLARTLHSQFAAKRDDTPKAEAAIQEYKKVLAQNPADNSSYRAVANLYENLGRTEEWRNWVTERSTNGNLPPEQRAEALTSLASKENTCANDITDVEPVKKTVIKDGKPAFEFTKPADPAALEQLKGCIQRGTELINQAMALEPERVKTAKSVDVNSLSDKDLDEFNNVVKPFESARSYKTSLLVQAMRLAEMEGRKEDRERLKTEADAARQQFSEIGEVTRQIKDLKEERAKAAAEAANIAKQK